MHNTSSKPAPLSPPPTTAALRSRRSTQQSHTHKSAHQAKATWWSSASKTPPAELRAAADAHKDRAASGSSSKRPSPAAAPVAAIKVRTSIHTDRARKTARKGLGKQSQQKQNPSSWHTSGGGPPGSCRHRKQVHPLACKHESTAYQPESRKRHPPSSFGGCSSRMVQQARCLESHHRDKKRRQACKQLHCKDSQQPHASVCKQGHCLDSRKAK